ncbi:hypothetical protein E4U54_001605, partial [Claviceps lovelessii]
MFTTWAGAIFANLENDQSASLAARVAATILPIIGVLVLVGIVGNVKGYTKPKSHYPVGGSDLKHGRLFRRFRQQQHWFKAGGQIIHDGYKRFPDEIWTIPSNDRTSIVLPPRFLEEVKNLPGSVASLGHALSD